MKHRRELLLLTFTICVASVFAQAPEKQTTSSRKEAAIADVRGVHHISESPTMVEAVKPVDPAVATPLEALNRLKQGNSRFFSGKSLSHRVSANARRAQIQAQAPFAVVLGCADSRVPVEMVFDQGFGDIFTIRVAGNITDPGTLGSIEYALKHLHSKLLVIMGHENCGAVTAALLPREQQQKEPENVRYLLDAVSPSVKELPAIRDKKSRMREAVIANVRTQTAKAKENPVIKAAIATGEVKLVGAFYEISSGAVDFLETEEELTLDPKPESRPTGH